MTSNDSRKNCVTQKKNIHFKSYRGEKKKVYNYRVRLPVRFMLFFFSYQILDIIFDFFLIPSLSEYTLL
ncbi:hypothetical protein BD770DRAFT_427490 [Pilaira anomala]|nr:hypothetical protein BD770DRAFT_427490 [Pilaira anomala]